MPRRILARLACLLCLALLCFGLWPFNFLAGNHVTWDPQAPGLRFTPNGIAYTPEPISWPGSNGSPEVRAITIELWVKPAKETGRSHYSEIAMLYRPGASGAFTIAQEGSTLFVLGRYRTASGSLIPGIRVSDVFHADETQFLSIVTGPAGTFVYSKGRLTDSNPGVVPVTDILRGQLVIGHSPIGYHPWSGELLGLALIGRELSATEIAGDHSQWTQHSGLQLSTRPGTAVLLTLAEQQGFTIHNNVTGGTDLIIPKYFRPLRRTLFSIPAAADFADLRDVVTNVLGFVPFGFLLMIYFVQVGRSRFRSTASTLLLCLLTTLLIEFLQAFLPSRDSSLADVINNVAGGMLGAVLALLASKLRSATQVDLVS